MTHPDPPSRDTSTTGHPQGSGSLQQLWLGEFHTSPPHSDLLSQGNKCLRGLVRNIWCPQGWLVSPGTPCGELCRIVLPAAPNILTTLEQGWRELPLKCTRVPMGAAGMRGGPGSPGDTTAGTRHSGREQSLTPSPSSVCTAGLACPAWKAPAMAAHHLQ